jgi:hypothetical protein
MMNVVRGVSAEGWGKIKYFRNIRRMLDEDRAFRRFYEQETTEIPPYFIDRIKQALGPLWEWMPRGAIYHDPYAYLKTELSQAVDLDLTSA